MQNSTGEATLSNEYEAYAWATPDELGEYGDAIEKEIQEAIILASKL